MDMARSAAAESVARYADMMSAMGTESRLRIMRLLLAAHHDGLVVGEIGAELGIPGSTLSHHLEKLKNEDLVTVRREGTQKNIIDTLQTRDELYDFLGYHAYEDKLDALFTQNKEIP
jgi:DNA-binding transcriptional ArsR family regulator